MNVIEPRPYTDPDVQRLVDEVQAVYVEMYGEPDVAPVDVGEFVLPRGVLLVGLSDGDAVAMGGWRRVDVASDDTVPTAEPTAEIKRMYVTPRAQRRGWGRRMLAAAEASAAAHGVTRLVLNTGPHQRAAIALYESEGYAPCAPFGHYAGYGEAVFLGKRLLADAGSGG